MASSPIKHVFVVMLENRSFDNMFAMSGIAGIVHATTANSNVYNGVVYNVRNGAPVSMLAGPTVNFVKNPGDAGCPHERRSPRATVLVGMKA